MENKEAVSRLGFVVTEEGVAYNKRSIVGYKDRGYCRFTFKLVGVSINIAIHRLQAFQKYRSSFMKKVQLFDI
jgi:hypothetical protein